jgi:predicted kinase
MESREARIVMAHLYIVRGLPGSGKSTFAKNMGIPHYESDQFRFKDGEYVFDPTDHSCHDKCFHEVVRSLKDGFDTVVSNTFTRLWEFQRYLDLPYPHTVITIEGNHGNIHNVPEEVIQRMRDRWENYTGT